MTEPSSMNDSLQAPRAMEILVGLLCGLIGLGLLGFVILLSYKVIERGEMPPQLIMFAVPIMAVLGGMFTLISHRLLLNRGAKVGGGLLSPTAWFVGGIIFTGLAIMLTIGAIWQQKWSVLVAPLPAIIFAKWCFSMAKTRLIKSAPD
jgi:hypothetical protein